MVRSALVSTVIWLSAMLAGVLLPLSTGWAAPPRSEYEVKAVYLYNFTKFVNWPADQANSALNICLIGRDPFEGRLDALNGKTVQGRQLKVLSFDVASPVLQCQMLFISQSESRRFNSLLERLQGMPVLTVSDIPGFLYEGGMIGLHSDGNLIRFSINLKRIRSEGLAVSSRLLELAVEVLQ